MVVILDPCMIRMQNNGVCDLLLCNGSVGDLVGHTGPSSGDVLDTVMGLRCWSGMMLVTNWFVAGDFQFLPTVWLLFLS